MTRITQAAAFTLIAFFMTGCAGALSTQKQRIDTELQVLEFNDIASRYMERPTFVYQSSMVSGPNILLVEIDPYGAYGESVGKIYRADEADIIIAIIDKYLSWEQMARENRDIINKEIGTIKGMTGMPQKASIYSANAASHYLTIETCTFGACGEDNYPHVMDRENATTLKALVKDLKVGTLKSAPSGTYE